MKYFMKALCVSVLFTGSALAADVTRAIKVDSEFREANMRWTGANAGGYNGMVALKANKGFVELCGVGKVTNIQLGNSIRNALRGGKLKINNKVVLQNFAFFATANGSLKSANANCARTSHRLSERINSVDLEYGRSVFRN